MIFQHPQTESHGISPLVCWCNKLCKYVYYCELSLNSKKKLSSYCYMMKLARFHLEILHLKLGLSKKKLPLPSTDVISH